MGNGDDWSELDGSAAGSLAGMTVPRLASRATGEVTAVAVLVVVAAAAAAFAHTFREASFAVLHVVTGQVDPIEAARRLVPLATFGILAVAAVLAAVVGHRAARRHGNRLGITALAAAARGDAPPPTGRGTLTRATATWIASFSMVSVGRESAILETGGTLGAKAGSCLGRHRDALTAGGIGAAFAAAYHAPIGAALYVEEHLGIWRRPRAALYTVLAAGISHLATTRLFGARAIFAHHTGRPSSVAALGLIAVVPATAGSRLFLHLRERTAVAARDRLPHAARVAVLVALMAATVTLVPLTAGNGMEALRFAGEHPTLTVGLTLAVGKLLATTGALASGVPGGAFSPTMATAAGWALLVFVALLSLGIPLHAPLWDGMLLAMVVGVAVGLDAPLTATFAVPEMAGDLGLVPLAAVVAAVAVALDRTWERRRGTPAVHDEDA